MRLDCKVCGVQVLGAELSNSLGEGLVPCRHVVAEICNYCEGMCRYNPAYARQLLAGEGFEWRLASITAEEIGWDQGSDQLHGLLGGHRELDSVEIGPPTFHVWVYTVGDVLVEREEW